MILGDLEEDKGEKNRIFGSENWSRRRQKRTKTPILGRLELPKGYRGVLHRHMGKVKKFGPSSTLILRRNRRPKNVRAPLGLTSYRT